MNLSSIKEDVAVILREELQNVYKFSPARPIAPCAIIESGSPFITVNDDEYDSIYATAWRVLILVPVSQNDVETTALDALLDALVPNLWDYTAISKLDVEKPFLTEANGATYLSTGINITIDSQGGQ